MLSSQPANLLGCGRRPNTAVTTADLCCICEKISRPCGLEP